MDLIDRKRIKNGLPKYDEGLSDKQMYYSTYDQINDPLYHAAQIAPLGSPMKLDVSKMRQPSLQVEVPKPKKPGPNLGNIANIAGAGIQGLVSTVGDFYSYGYDKSVQDLNNQAGTNQETTNGITYTTQNFIGDDEYRNAAKQADNKILGSVGTAASAGASIGSVIPGVGTAIGGAVGAVGGLISGIFGSKKAKREARRRIEEQRQRAAIQNDFARGVATTKGLNLDYIREHGNTETQSLYKDGKTPVYSPFGPINAEADSKVSKGEVAIDTQTGSRYRIPTGPNDTALFAGGKNPNTAIITNKYGLSDIAMENPELAIQMQKELKEAGMLKKTKGEYKCGKMPKYLDGYSAMNLGVHGLGALTGLYQYLSAKNDTPYKPNTYVANPYANKGLDILAGLRVNQYPILRQLRDAEARGMYALNNSGGLSGSQKYLGRIAGVRNTQSSIADALMKIQEQNNAYKAQYGSTLINTGAQEAANKMNALRADNDVYMKSHAARQQGMQTGLYNMQNNLQSWLANQFKYDQFLKTYGLYSTDLNNKRV